LPAGLSSSAKALFNASIRSSSKDRYDKSLKIFFSKFKVLNRINIYNFISSLKSTSSMEVFLAAVSRFSGVSLFSDVIVKRIVDGKAKFVRPSVFPRPVNTIELWNFIRYASDFSRVEQFVLELMILLCARPSDLSGLSASQIIVGDTFVTVNRLGTKGDRRYRGTAILVPITKSVFIPTLSDGITDALCSIASLMTRALNLCFPGNSLSPGIIRKSSACMLRQRNLPNRDIMEIGGWASEETLRRFYSRANTNWISSLSLHNLSTVSFNQWPEMLLAP
jgi:integrase